MRHVNLDAEHNHQRESRMREIRQSGLEGGGAVRGSPYPYSTSLGAAPSVWRKQIESTWLEERVLSPFRNPPHNLPGGYEPERPRDEARGSVAAGAVHPQVAARLGFGADAAVVPWETLRLGGIDLSLIHI